MRNLLNINIRYGSDVPVPMTQFAFEYYDGYGYEYDFNHEEYENEIESLFGSFEIFNDFKMTCFE